MGVLEFTGFRGLGVESLRFFWLTACRALRGRSTPNLARRLHRRTFAPHAASRFHFFRGAAFLVLRRGLSLSKALLLFLAELWNQLCVLPISLAGCCSLAARCLLYVLHLPLLVF